MKKPTRKSNHEQSRRHCHRHRHRRPLIVISILLGVIVVFTTSIITPCQALEEPLGGILTTTMTTTTTTTTMTNSQQKSLTKPKRKNNNNHVMLTSRGGGGSNNSKNVKQNTQTTKIPTKKATTTAPAITSTTNAANTATTTVITKKKPSFYWAVFHNWMYFLSLGFNAVNVPFMIRQIIDGGEENTSSRKHKPSPEAIALSGKVESVDKFLTFLGIGFLSALSDKFGRKPLMAWSAIGFMITNLIQSQVSYSNPNAVALLYLADFVDGCSSCMLPLCQTYVTDCSAPADRAANLGVFQGLSAGGAFIFAFPIGGVLGAKYGPRLPLLIAAGIQFINAMIILFITPESHPMSTTTTTTTTGSSTETKKKTLDLTEANPLGSIRRLFFDKKQNPLLRIAAASYFLASLARSSLDAQFTNYSNIRFGWTQAQSGPVLVLVGLMLAIAPRILVPLMGLKNSILGGLLIFSIGLTLTGLAPTPSGFVFGILIVAIGCTCLPTLQALLANLASDDDRGALLGAMGSLSELTGSIGSTLYAVVLALYTSDHAPLPIPGMHFLVGSALLLVAWMVALPGLALHKNDAALQV